MTVEVGVKDNVDSVVLAVVCGLEVKGVVVKCVDVVDVTVEVKLDCVGVVKDNVGVVSVETEGVGVNVVVVDKDVDLCVLLDVDVGGAVEVD